MLLFAVSLVDPLAWILQPIDVAQERQERREV